MSLADLTAWGVLALAVVAFVLELQRTRNNDATERTLVPISVVAWGAVAWLIL